MLKAAMASLSRNFICNYLRFNTLKRSVSTKLNEGSLLSSNNLHEESSPLMVNEVLEQLNLKDGQTVLDMTFGDGMHSEAILDSNKDVKVLALDRDPCAFLKAEALSEKHPGRVKSLQGRFSDLPSLLRPLGVSKNSLDAILLDVGCSSMQLNDAERGFSSEVDGPLDMRMDGLNASTSITAQDVLLKAQEHDLSRIFRIYGGEEQGRKIARSIVTYRYNQSSLDSTLQLKEFLQNVSEERSTRVVRNVFYALRTFVNNEFNELNFAMLFAQQYLKKDGRIVMLTYNQPEDIIVKRHITGNVFENNPNPMPLKYYNQSLNLSPVEINKLKSSVWMPLSKHVITPKKQERSRNRVRNVKLRGAVKMV